MVNLTYLSYELHEVALPHLSLEQHVLVASRGGECDLGRLVQGVHPDRAREVAELHDGILVAPLVLIRQPCPSTQTQIYAPVSRLEVRLAPAALTEVVHGRREDWVDLQRQSKLQLCLRRTT